MGGRAECYQIACCLHSGREVQSPGYSTPAGTDERSQGSSSSAIR